MEQNPVLAPCPELHFQALHAGGALASAPSPTSHQVVPLLVGAHVVVEPSLAFQRQGRVSSDIWDKDREALSMQLVTAPAIICLIATAFPQSRDQVQSRSWWGAGENGNCSPSILWLPPECVFESGSVRVIYCCYQSIVN